MCFTLLPSAKSACFLYMQMLQQDRKCATRTVFAPLRSVQNQRPLDVVDLLMLPKHDLLEGCQPDSGKHERFPSLTYLPLQGLRIFHFVKSAEPASQVPISYILVNRAGGNWSTLRSGRRSYR